MGMQKIGEITAALGAAGYGRNAGSGDPKRHHRGRAQRHRQRWQTIAVVARAAGLGSPALIVIGEVVRLAGSAGAELPRRQSA